MKTLVLLLFLLPSISHAQQWIKMDPMGRSYKGKFLAIEEYGFTSQSEMVFSRIRVLDMWKKQAVKEEIMIQAPGNNELNLAQVRRKARLSAKRVFKDYQIKTL